ncbi:MAG: hypothetical protein ACRDNX_11510, partial [Gaiellaceae bacterium]
MMLYPDHETRQLLVREHQAELKRHARRPHLGWEKSRSETTVDRTDTMFDRSATIFDRSATIVQS